MQILVPIVLFLSNLLNYLDRQLFSALLPVLSPVFHLSDPLVGALGSSFTLSYLLAAPLSGYLSDRIHPKRVLAGGVLVFSGGIMICALAQGVFTLFFGPFTHRDWRGGLICRRATVDGGKKRGRPKIGFFPLRHALGGRIRICPGHPCNSYILPFHLDDPRSSRCSARGDSFFCDVPVSGQGGVSRPP